MSNFFHETPPFFAQSKVVVRSLAAQRKHSVKMADLQGFRYVPLTSLNEWLLGQREVKKRNARRQESKHGANGSNETAFAPDIHAQS